ncbi:LLM class flavin-dependent oxidoreductase [Streptomyces sp. NPDC088816]|uniref:LLM class flavin-dependent oxidoreductase n=1 Tax=Streptomyces sp. NPDC088816 TaxID=3365906 RepID=UPI00380E1A60
MCQRPGVQRGLPERHRGQHARRPGGEPPLQDARAVEEFRDPRLVLASAYRVVDYAHDGEIWQFPTSTSVPKPVQRPTPPMWIAARDPASHEFAVGAGCNVMVTPLMKGDEEVVDLKRKFDDAVANHPEVPRPDLMVLRHTHVHAEDDPEGWRPAAAAISKFYRTFDAWFGNRTPPVDGFLEPSPESKFAERPEFAPESLHRTAMIGTPGEVVERLRRYEELGVDEFSFWCDNGLPHEEKRKSLELFVKEVVPAFR